MQRILFATALLASLGPLARATEIRPKLPAGSNHEPTCGLRSSTAEVPNFQRHVLPLMGRLGCNGRACHGSFQGQGGFRLSLFGYDFKSDHNALSPGICRTARCRKTPSRAST